MFHLSRELSDTIGIKVCRAIAAFLSVLMAKCLFMIILTLQQGITTGTQNPILILPP